jgi:hypothetical protein
MRDSDGFLSGSGRMKSGLKSALRKEGDETSKTLGFQMKPIGCVGGIDSKSKIVWSKTLYSTRDSSEM